METTSSMKRAAISIMYAKIPLVRNYVLDAVKTIVTNTASGTTQANALGANDRHTCVILVRKGRVARKIDTITVPDSPMPL